MIEVGNTSRDEGTLLPMDVRGRINEEVRWQNKIEPFSRTNS